MKFKKGDKVRILDGSKICDYTACWCYLMEKYVGKLTTIVGDTPYRGKPGYKLKDCEDYIWDERGLELVTNEQIIIYRKDNEVIALNKATGVKAVAKCSPEDEFDFKTGAKLAFERLINPIKIVKQEKYKVGDKVKIVEKWGKACYQNSKGKMDKWLGKIMTIRELYCGDYIMEEDIEEHCGNGWRWNDNCIEGKVVSDKIKDELKEEPKLKPGDTIELIKGKFSVPVGARGTLVKNYSGDPNYWVVDFHVKYSATHNCECLPSKTGLFLFDDAFKKVSE